MLKRSPFFFLAFLALAYLYISVAGVIPVHATEDECRRALVPLEMSLSGDWLRPTINGELYLNKPPLYNWIVATSYEICDRYSPFALRIPVVLSILLHGLLIWWVARKFISNTAATFTALAFMTNWRTLTLDSLLGLLEHTLALVMYAGFMVIFLLGEKKKYLLMFVAGYFIAALGFLIKGMPALAHHLIALMVYCSLIKKYKLFFSWQHVVGVAVFGIVCAAFYIPFLLHNDVTFAEVMQTLVDESAKRYGFRSITNFIHVIFDFPVDVMRHFLPWTLFLIFTFRKGFMQHLQENRFVAFNVFLFISNILVYWLASLKNPHYLYFLLPLLFTVLFYEFEKTPEQNWRKKSMAVLLGTGLAFAFLVSLYLPFSDWIDTISYRVLKSICLIALFGVVLFFFFQKPNYRWHAFFAGMIALRLSFNWFVVPQRVEDQMRYPRYADEVQHIVQDAPLSIMATYPAGYYDAITFPLEVKRKKILPIASSFNDAGYYLVDDDYLQKSGQVPLFNFPYEYADKHEWIKGNMYLIKR